MPEVGMEGHLSSSGRACCWWARADWARLSALSLTAARHRAHRLLDFDVVVDFTNRSGQFIHGTKGVGRRRRSAFEKPCAIAILSPRLTATKRGACRARTLAGFQGLIRITSSTGNHNFPHALIVVTDACVLLRSRTSYGSIFSFRGQAGFSPTQRPLLSLSSSEPPPPGLVPSARKAACWLLPGINRRSSSNRDRERFSASASPWQAACLLTRRLGISFAS